MPTNEKDELNHSVAAGHELRDLSVRGIVLFGLALVVMGAFALIVTTAWQLALAKRPPSLQIPPANLMNAPVPPLPPEPRLESAPGVALEQLRAQENQLLDSYGWVDEKAGIARIPIDRAMELLLQRGLPARSPGENKFQDNGAQSPSNANGGRMMESYP